MTFGYAMFAATALRGPAFAPVCPNFVCTCAAGALRGDDGRQALARPMVTSELALPVAVPVIPVTNSR